MTGNCFFCKNTFKKRERKRKFCSLICSNNFNKNGLKKVELPIYSSELAEFVGMCLGDGTISKYQVGITLNTFADKEYIPYVVRLVKKLFPGLHISIIKRKDNATDIRVNSRIVSDFITNMGIISKNKIIPLWIFSRSEYKYACVRGLFDTEGSISFKIYRSKKRTSLYKQLNFRNYQIEFIKFVRDVLLDLGLKPTSTLKKSLYLSNDKAINIFKKNIGFSNPKLQRRSSVFNETDLISLLGSTS